MSSTVTQEVVLMRSRSQMVRKVPVFGAVPPDAYERLREIAAAEDRPVSQVVRRMILAGLQATETR